jgi:hypothetical protein
VVIKTVVGSLYYAYKYKKQIAQATVIPILLSMILEWLLANITTGFLAVILLLPQFVLPAIVAINVHRVVISGDNSVPKWGRFKIGKIELRFIGYSMLMITAFLPVALLSALDVSPVVTLSLILLVILPLICRLSIIFPAIAVGKDVSLQYAWEVSKSNTLYICGVMLLMFLLSMLVIMPIAFLSSSQLLLGVIGQIVGIFIIVSLSLTYSHIVKVKQN